jgi:hypothetical protein
VEKPVGNQPGNTSNIGHVNGAIARVVMHVMVEATSICIEYAIVNDVEVIDLFPIIHVHTCIYLKDCKKDPNYSKYKNVENLNQPLCFIVGNIQFNDLPWSL